MGDATTVHFQLNEKLLDEAKKIQQSRQILKDRLKKVEEGKSKVSASVYDRVRSDYRAQLQETTDQLLQKKNDIDRELATLYETRRKVSDNLKKHKEDLEELEFRKSLGELDNEQYLIQSRDISGKISKFEQIVTAVSHNIAQYESLFADDSQWSADMEEAPAVNEPTPRPKKAIKEDSDYMVGSSPSGYFSPDAEHETDVEEMDDAQPTALSDETGKSGPARLVIVRGTNVGTEYVITKEASIGRSSSNDVILKEAKVSRQHAIIKRHGNEYMIYDLQSSNGVIVNNERVTEFVLSDGDKIQIGDFVMQLQIR